MVAIFGGGERKGRWRVKLRTRVVAIFGGYDLDMTDAVFEGREVQVTVFAMFGGVHIKVPDGVEVRNHGSGIFGGYGVAGSKSPRPERAGARGQGLAIFGGVGGESRQAEKAARRPPPARTLDPGFEPHPGEPVRVGEDLVGEDRPEVGEVQHHEYDERADDGAADEPPWACSAK